MNDAYDQHGSRLDHVEHRIWKALKKRAPESLVYKWVHMRLLDDRRVHVVKLHIETWRKTGRDLTKPRLRISDVGLRFSGDDQPKLHFVPNSSALISSHGRADAGSA